MPDRKKVIEGLEFTLVESCWDADRAFDEQLMIEAVTDAITLLKAQEPRLMTLEASDADWRDGVLWLEQRDYKPIRPCLFRNCREQLLFGRLERVMCFDVVGSTMDGGKMLKNYGVKWRCWTSRPTDEQREATQWTAQS